MCSFLNKLKKLQGKKILMTKRCEYKKRNKITNYGSARTGHQHKYNKFKNSQDSS